MYFCPETTEEFRGLRAAFSVTLCPHKVTKSVHSKRGDGSTPTTSKRKLQRVCADFSSFAVAAYLLTSGVVLIVISDNTHSFIQNYALSVQSSANLSCLVPLSNAAAKVKRKHLNLKFRLFDEV